MTADSAYAVVAKRIRAVDPRAFYCQCCPHRPQPEYPDLHYPFANCKCCPRTIPESEYDPVSRTPRKCGACRRREWDTGIVSAFLGAAAAGWLAAILVQGWPAVILGGAMAAFWGALIAYAWWSRRRYPTAS